MRLVRPISKLKHSVALSESLYNDVIRLALCILLHNMTVGVDPGRQRVMIGGVNILNDDWGKAISKIKQVSSTDVVLFQQRSISIALAS